MYIILVCRGLSVATTYGQGNFAESQGKVRDKSRNLFFQILWESCFKKRRMFVEFVKFDSMMPHMIKMIQLMSL